MSQAPVLAVLIGGPADGRRVQLRDGVRYVSTAGYMRACPTQQPAQVAVQSVATERHDYEEFWGVRTLRVYKHHSLSDDAAMQRLIDRYPPEVVR